MPELLIKDVPDELHQKLKRQAARNRRSLTKEALAPLETALAEEASPEVVLPAPFKGSFRINDEWIGMAKREGRV